MLTQDDSPQRELKQRIEDDVLIKSSPETSILTGGQEGPWLFDFRARLLEPHFLKLVADLFWEKYQNEYPFQVGGLESASLPIIAAIVLRGLDRGMPVNGFYIRKSRKPKGLQKIIEGTLTDEPIVLVDDLINSGGTFLKQIEVLAKENKRVKNIFALVRFRDMETYTFATSRGISIFSPFTLADFGLAMDKKSPPPDSQAFEVLWGVRSPKPNYSIRAPKSAPALDDDKVYVGSDDGSMRAFLQEDGREVWVHSIFTMSGDGKTVLSSPAVYKDTVYFGAYDGNFYALDAQTGEKKWIYMEADWVGSSPAVADDLDLVFIGLEFGLWKKKGGIVALDAKTGVSRWEYAVMPDFTHGSPAYSRTCNAVVIGSNDGVLYCFRATDGKLLWTYKTGGEIKGTPMFDDNKSRVYVGSYDGNMYCIDVNKGSPVYVFETKSAICSAPLVYDGHVYFGSTDKSVYCVRADTGEKKWVFTAGGRVMASPEIINSRLYIGCNDGRLYELDLETGKNTAFYQTTERITNKIAYNAQTKKFFLPTYANELYCLIRK
jgi:outer membrane protein assembly factor BamB/adenine/guanine phosphoribosyltransferase-like PRPP-binding protein